VIVTDSEKFGYLNIVKIARRIVDIRDALNFLTKAAW